MTNELDEKRFRDKRECENWLKEQPRSRIFPFLSAEYCVIADWGRECGVPYPCVGITRMVCMEHPNERQQWEEVPTFELEWWQIKLIRTLGGKEMLSAGATVVLTELFSVAQ